MHNAPLPPLTILDVAHEWLHLLAMVAEHAADGQWDAAQTAHDSAEIARAEILRRLAALPVPVPA